MSAQPKTINGIPVPLTPPETSLASQVIGTLSSGTTPVTLNANTSFIRVYGISQDVFLKWGTATVTTSAFDEIIPAGQIVDLFVPTRQTSVNFLERVASGTVVLIQK